jgi:hypothetical protein
VDDGVARSGAVGSVINCHNNVGSAMKKWPITLFYTVDREVALTESASLPNY